MSYTESVQELVTELRRGKYLPVQQKAADALVLQAAILDKLSSEIERTRLRAAEGVAFGMRK